MHLDLDDAVSVASLATPTLDVEAEAPVAVAAHAGVRRVGKHRADEVEKSAIRRGVRSRRAPDGALVDIDHLVQRFDSVDAVVVAGPGMRAVEVAQKRLLDNLVDEARFSAAGNARHADELAQRNLHVDILEVVRARAVDDERLTVARPARCGNRNAHAPAEVRARDRFLVCRDFLRRADRDHFAAVFARTRPDIHHIVCCTDRFLVVLHHNQGVAEVAHLLQRLEQARVVPLMQADARLVENIQHAHQPAADLGGKTDALRLAAGKRHGGTRERQIV